MSSPSDVKSTLRAEAKEVGDRAKATLAQEANARMDQAKDMAADKTQETADAADAAAAQFDPASPQAEAMQHVADHIEGVASQLRHADVTKLASQASDVIRRNPLLFIGGAAVAGFAAARFLKARDPQPAHSGHDDPWGMPSPAKHNSPSDPSDHTTVMAKINGGRDDA
ncbi:hypothetical protein [Algirhabdus cladophorae]|uniref:hypothetical protein n=1 Tax=Algirhabdus cladophorae TaxID=3377108 RepID=UPI003B847690